MCSATIVISLLNLPNEPVLQSCTEPYWSHQLHVFGLPPGFQIGACASICADHRSNLTLSRPDLPNNASWRTLTLAHFATYPPQSFVLTQLLYFTLLYMYTLTFVNRVCLIWIAMWCWEMQSLYWSFWYYNVCVCVCLHAAVLSCSRCSFPSPQTSWSSLAGSPSYCMLPRCFLSLFYFNSVQPCLSNQGLAFTSRTLHKNPVDIWRENTCAFTRMHASSV